MQFRKSVFYHKDIQNFIHPRKLLYTFVDLIQWTLIPISNPVPFRATNAWIQIHWSISVFSFTVTLTCQRKFTNRRKIAPFGKRSWFNWIIWMLKSFRRRFFLIFLKAFHWKVCDASNEALQLSPFGLNSPSEKSSMSLWMKSKKN